MNTLHFSSIDPAQAALQNPLIGFYPLDSTTGYFSLMAERWSRARLRLYDPQLKLLGEQLLEPSPYHSNLIQTKATGLPDCFSYSWQLEREGQWSPEFADPFHPWLSGTHLWRQQGARYNLSWVQLPRRSDRFDPSCNRPLLTTQELRIYECHVRAATMQHPAVPPALRGTLQALPQLLDHLESLGMNAIELMPLQEFDELSLQRIAPSSSDPRVNFWGYMPCHLMSLMRAYSADGTSLGAEEALRDFVWQAHRRGIAVIVDLVLNHLDLQADPGLVHALPYSAFHRDPQGKWIDYTGCGHTLQASHSVTTAALLHCLHYWAGRFGIDGFRLDLTAALTRRPDGVCDPYTGLLQAISQDPLLKELHWIAEPWDASGGWLLGKTASLGFYEWNDRYRDDLRRFIHFGEAKGLAATRLCGSSDLYRQEQKPCGIHYITSHDGYCLRDLVSYERRHNEGNGEQNRDGCPLNFSCNHGVEGPTQDSSLEQLRRAQMKNFLLALALSHGPIMLLSGDEYGHSRKGNNNPWCQDNEINALDWSKLGCELHSYWKKLMQWRRSFSLLCEPHFLSPEQCLWYRSNGEAADWREESHLLFYELRYGEQRALVAFHTGPQPELLSVDSDLWVCWLSSRPILPVKRAQLQLQGRSSALWIDRSSYEALTRSADSSQ